MQFLLLYSLAFSRLSEVCLLCYTMLCQVLFFCEVVVHGCCEEDVEWAKRIDDQEKREMAKRIEEKAAITDQTAWRWH